MEVIVGALVFFFLFLFIEIFLTESWCFEKDLIKSYMQAKRITNRVAVAIPHEIVISWNSNYSIC